MRGVKFENLMAIVDFLYLGETNILQENLDSFLAIAEELQLKGLMGQNKEDIVKSEVFERSPKTPLLTNTRQVFIQEPIISKSQKYFKFDEQRPLNDDTDENIASTTNFSGDTQDLDEKVRSLMGRSKNCDTEGWKKGYVCKVCGKEGQSINVKSHIESNHLEGVSVPCNECEKTFRSRNALSKHMKNHAK